MKLRLMTAALALVAALTVPGRASAQEQAAEPTGPDTVVFTAKRGPVTFTHGKHAKAAECVACHHESKAEKPLESKYQKCSACHTETPAAPMKTDAKNAMHNTVAKEGVCYSCHTKEAAAGKTVPSKCTDCHKREG